MRHDRRPRENVRLLQKVATVDHGNLASTDSRWPVLLPQLERDPLESLGDINILKLVWCAHREPAQTPCVLHIAIAAVVDEVFSDRLVFKPRQAYPSRIV